MKQMLSFDDVLLQPRFSDIKSRKDVDTSTTIGDNYLEFPIISANMDSVTGVDMTHAMEKVGGVGCLHRFWSIEDNVSALKKSALNTWVSVGLGEYEFERALALYDAGATTILIDVANGASMDVVRQATNLRKQLGGYLDIIIGNFASRTAITTFNERAGSTFAGYKVGIGGGSACLTRVVTGCGMPTFASLLDIRSISDKLDIIADGGIRNSGDIAKALAAGAKAVMCGKLLAGTSEAPSEVVEQWKNERGGETSKYKKYRGSASQESYEAQGKVAEYRAAEGASFLIPYTGTVSEVVQQLNGGLRSAMSYMNAASIEEFKYNAEFIQITNAGLKENGSHGKL